MSASNRLNLWMAADTTERDALSAANGLASGDFCLVEATMNLYVYEGSRWRPIAGLATKGHYALSGVNITASTATLYQRQACTFRAVLDQAPIAVVLAPDNDSDWDVMADTVVSVDEFGFVVEGRSNVVAAATEAYVDGTYTINY